jgi:hypothetical protein
MSDIITNTKDFYSEYKDSPKTGERRKALEQYFSTGGVIRTGNGKPWPKLIYPSSAVLETKLNQIRERKAIFARKMLDWRAKLFVSSLYHEINHMKKIIDPVYWKHLTKIATDKDYSADFKSVKLPVHLVGDKKWKPMVKMFVDDIEYRKQLVETVTTSIIYKKDKKVAKYADDLKDFRVGASEKQIEELKDRIEELEKEEQSINELKKWAKE